MTSAQLASSYRRLQRHGVREPAPYPELEKDCLIWPWGKDRNGRAVACVDRKGDNAARHLWRLFRGPIPNKWEVCHRCDNRSCVELTHLFIDTRTGNLADMVRRGRVLSPKGEANVMAKLTWSEVAEIREEYGDGNNGVLQRELAVEYNVSPAKISQIILYQSWIPDSPQKTPQEAQGAQI